MATLFGIVMLTHQVGGFLGAWLGGKVFEATGSYDWIWYVDIVLAVGRRAGPPADPRSALCVRPPHAAGGAPQRLAHRATAMNPRTQRAAARRRSLPTLLRAGARRTCW